MNRLSSILYFIGTFIGENPTTKLVTTSKTIVGAINETHGRIHVSSQTPTSLDGKDGDIWIVYEGAEANTESSTE